MMMTMRQVKELATLRPLLSLVLLVACALPSAASAGEVYRWVDADGVVHYSDRASTRSAESVTIKPLAPASGAATRPASQSAQDGGASSETAAAKTKNANDRVAAIRADECEKAKARLTKFRAADRLLITDPEGVQREMTPDEKIQALAQAEEQEQAFCGGG